MSRYLNRSRARKRHPADRFAPVELTDPLDRAVYFLGALTQVWTIVEGLIDAWVDRVHSAGGSTRIQAGLPPSLDRELDYLTAALRIGLIEPEGLAEAERLIAELHATKNFCHRFLHGIAEFETAKFTVAPSRVKGGRRTILRNTYTPEQRIRHYKRALQIAYDLSEFLLPGARRDFLDQQRQLPIA